jgi:hypothetical protein
MSKKLNIDSWNIDQLLQSYNIYLSFFNMSKDAIEDFVKKNVDKTSIFAYVLYSLNSKEQVDKNFYKEIIIRSNLHPDIKSKKFNNLEITNIYQKVIPEIIEQIRIEGEEEVEEEEKNIIISKLKIYSDQVSEILRNEEKKNLELKDFLLKKYNLKNLDNIEKKIDDSELIELNIYKLRLKFFNKLLEQINILIKNIEEGETLSFSEEKLESVLKYIIFKINDMSDKIFENKDTIGLKKINKMISKLNLEKELMKETRTEETRTEETRKEEEVPIIEEEITTKEEEIPTIEIENLVKIDFDSNIKKLKNDIKILNEIVSSNIKEGDLKKAEINQKQLLRAKKERMVNILLKRIKNLTVEQKGVIEDIFSVFDKLDTIEDYLKKDFAFDILSQKLGQIFKEGIVDELSLNRLKQNIEKSLVEVDEKKADLISKRKDEIRKKISDLKKRKEDLDDEGIIDTKLNKEIEGLDLILGKSDTLPIFINNFNTVDSLVKVDSVDTIETPFGVRESNLPDKLISLKKIYHEKNTPKELKRLIETEIIEACKNNILTEFMMNDFFKISNEEDIIEKKELAKKLEILPSQERNKALAELLLKGYVTKEEYLLLQDKLSKKRNLKISSKKTPILIVKRQPFVITKS